MDVQNELANRIDSYSNWARYDAACKRLLANKQVLARILKSCVPEFYDCDCKDIESKYIEGTPEISTIPVHQDAEFIEGMNTEDATEKEGTVYFDIRFYALSPVDGSLIRVIVNVEVQNSFSPGYPLVKRGIYYGSRLISAQYGTVFENQHYEKIEKVYSIWVCPNPPAERRNSICEYSIGERVLVGKSNEKKENYDLMTVMLICLGGSADDNYKGIIKMLDVLLSRKVDPEEKKKVLNEEFEISMTKEMERQAVEMCNLSQGVVDDTTVDHIISMRNKSDMSIEECLDMIGVPEYKWETYIAMVEERMNLQPA